MNHKIEDAIRNGTAETEGETNEVLKAEGANVRMDYDKTSLELTEEEKAVTRCGDAPKTANGYAIFDDGIKRWKGVVIDGTVNFAVDVIDGKPVQTVYATICGHTFHVAGNMLVD